MRLHILAFIDSLTHQYLLRLIIQLLITIETKLINKNTDNLFSSQKSSAGRIMLLIFLLLCQHHVIDVTHNLIDLFQFLSKNGHACILKYFKMLFLTFLLVKIRNSRSTLIQKSKWCIQMVHTTFTFAVLLFQDQHFYQY